MTPLNATFVIGPPRSGTTLLRDLLAAHPAVTAHSEDFHPFHHNLSLFRDVRLGDLGEHENFRLTCLEATDAVRQRYRRRIAEACRASGCSHFILKISTLSMQVDYVKALVPEARFIQIVRDGRDAACSMEDLRAELERQQGWPRLLGPAPDPLGLWCAEHFDAKLLRAAASWSYHARRSLLDLRFAGDTCYRRVRYEDLLTDPSSVVQRLLRFLDLDLTDAVEARLKAVQDTPRGHELVGFSTTQASGPRRGRYTRELGRDIRTIIAPLLEMPMLLLGYQPDPWPERDAFYSACERLRIDAELLKARIYDVCGRFERQWAAFAPRQLLADTPFTPDSRPLLVDGATVGSRRSIVDGQIRTSLSWVQKQDRRYSFADPGGLWPRLAPQLDGQHTLAQLIDPTELAAALPSLSVLRDRGFVGAT